MVTEQANPFNVTKAVDFSDAEIIKTFVDLPGAGFRGLARPTSPMPMFLLGGKGSGRTHLMRYFSYPVQKLRSDNVVRDLQTEGYIGVYLRCTGLNAGRFTGKGQPDETWETIFPYYMDLWLAQLTLATVADAFRLDEDFLKAESAICREIIGLFETDSIETANTVKELGRLVHALQREIDVAVNNAAITRQINVVIRVSRGALPFRIPQILGRHVPKLQNVKLLYLVDELENLTALQQKYVNTLVREREDPCSFKIGARRYGLRTRRTYAADEENREGSEFEIVYLDEYYLNEAQGHNTFMRGMVARRIAGAAAPDTKEVASRLDASFSDLAQDRFLTEETAFLLKKPSQEREHFRRLSTYLADTHITTQQIDAIIAALAMPELPLLEKINTFLLYQDWSSQKDLLASAERIGMEARLFGRNEGGAPRHANAWDKFKFDLFAQLLRENDQPQRYLGIRVFIAMACGLPRNLLIILKHIYKWAVFYGEQPFAAGEPVSREAQQAGVREAANWFYQDARVLGSRGQEVQDAIGRLGTLFRRLRFSDKPVESSLIAFSADLAKANEAAREIIRLAEQWSLLISIGGGQRDRNRESVDSKYQLNSMLCPRWDLPIYRRGTIALSAVEINAVFDPSSQDRFEEIVNKRLLHMNAPFRRTTGRPGRAQTVLPGFEHD